MDPTGAAAEGRRVVVGVDRSAGARGAPASALTAAVRTGARVELLSAFPVDLAGVLDGPPAGSEVTVDVEEGAPADVLARRADGAALLVVGSRSRLEGMVLGPVALHTVVHARCPVMVVHPEATAPATGPA